MLTGSGLQHDLKFSPHFLPNFDTHTHSDSESHSSTTRRTSSHTKLSLQHREEAMRSRVWFPLTGLLAWLCCFHLGPVQGEKVLVFPADGSQWLSMKILVKELGRRGHEVTVLVSESSQLIQGSDSYKTEVYKVPYTQDETDKNYKRFREGLFDQQPGLADLFVNVDRLLIFTSPQVVGCEALLDNEPLMTKLRTEGFDMMLTDPFLPCGSILAHIFSIPAVYFMRLLPCELDIKANKCPSPVSYIPKSFSGNTDRMSFPERAKNMMMSFLESYLCPVMYQKFDELVSKRIQDGMSYKELISEGAIWLLRYDFVFDWPKPLMPNMVLIGGINCAKTAPLPADLKEFVDASGDDGFIVFTLGSWVSDMPEAKAKQFFDAFRQIPQRVIWRYTGEIPKDVPKNVKLMKWVPQKDLLAHPKAKVFMTHGGSHGIYESVCNGVPMLIFPLFGDQRDNTHQMVSRGVAVKLNIFDVTTETLLDGLKKVIYDKGYKERMVGLSQIHLDRPVEPLDLAVFWSEFVMRHKGASHLRVAAHDLNWFQYHSLDVIGFLVFVFVAVLWVTLKSCLFCTRKCCGKRGAKKTSE